MLAQARYYREKLNVDPGDPAGKHAVVEAYIQVLQTPPLGSRYMGSGVAMTVGRFGTASSGGSLPPGHCSCMSIKALWERW